MIWRRIIVFGVAISSLSSLKADAQYLQASVVDSVLLKEALWAVFYPDRDHVVFRSGYAFYEWSLKTGEIKEHPVKEIAWQPEWVPSFFNHDSTEISWTNKEWILRLSTEDWHEIDYIEGNNLYQPFQYTSDDASFVGGVGTRLIEMSKKSGEEIRVIDEEPGYFFAGVAISPDGTKIGTVVSSGKPQERKSIRVYDFASGDLLWEVEPGLEYLERYQVQFSPDGKKVMHLTTDPDTSWVSQFDTETGDLLLKTPATTDDVLVSRYSRDGTTILIAENDGRIRIFDATTGEVLCDCWRRIHGQYDYPYWADFSADGRRFVTATKSGVRVWDLSVISTVEDLNFSELHLRSIHPNPADAFITVPFSLETYSRVHLELYDIYGKQCGNPVVRNYEGGTHRIEYNTSGLASGIYTLVLRSENNLIQQQIHIIH